MESINNIKMLLSNELKQSTSHVFLKQPLRECTSQSKDRVKRHGSSKIHKQKAIDKEDLLHRVK